MGDSARALPTLERLLAEPELAGADWLVFNPRAERLTHGPTDAFATRLRAEIDARWIAADGYNEVLLSGASLGSVILRQAFVMAAGRDPRIPRSTPWTDSVTRVVLIAGIGRGVNIENEGFWKWPLRVSRYLPVLRRSIVYDQLRGADGVSSARIAWIHHFAELNAIAARGDARVRLPLIVQVLGTQDDLVKRDDNIDLDQFPNAFHLSVPGVRHGAMFPPGHDPARYAIYKEAFTGKLERAAAQRAYRATDDSITRVIFLLHGVRSTRDNWIRQLAPILRERIPGALVIESSYGEASLLSFALRPLRRRERLWLQDQYTEALARHPRARIDVVAHSNGTHVLGESLSRVSVMRFDRVVLLGSVLPADYPWRERHAHKQVTVVRSDRAASDGVVAILASGLRGVGMAGVGTSGWRGFDDAGNFLLEPPWIAGGHAATLSEDRLLSVADFIATGRMALHHEAPAVRPTLPMRWASALAPWLMFLLVVSFAALTVLWISRSSETRRWPRIGWVGAIVLLCAIALDVF